MSEKKPLFGVLAGEPEIIGERCADGGKCHHRCTDTCSRRATCAPLSGSGLLVDWSVPKPAEPATAQDELLAGITWQADPYEANVYRMLRGNNWVAHIRMNGEMLVERHAAMLTAMLATRPAQTEQQPLIFINPMVVDEIEGRRKPSPGGLTWSRKACAHWTFPLYAARPAQTEQQPVAWLIDWPEEPELGHYFSDEPNEHARSRPLYADPIAQAAPQPEQSKVSRSYRLLVAACNRIEADGEEFEGPDGITVGVPIGSWEAFTETLDEFRTALRQIDAALAARGGAGDE